MVSILKNKIVLAIIGLLVVTIPLLLPNYHLRTITQVVILALFTLSWRLLWYEIGLLSFGHALYFGFGAYVSVLGWLNIEGLGFLSGVLLGGLTAALLGLVLGIFLVRVSGTYFALLTLALNSLFWAIAWKWRTLTGGDDGIGDFPRPDIWGLDMSDRLNFYLVALVIVALCTFIYWHLTRTPMGNLINCVKSNEERSRFIGLNVKAYKVFVFTLSGFFAGIAGALYAQFQEFICTTYIDMFMSTDVLFMAFIGGTGHLLGAFLGSGVFVYLTDYLGSYTDRYELVLGLIFVVIVMFAPSGLLGLFPDRQKKTGKTA